jgi:acyl carrier protein
MNEFIEIFAEIFDETALDLFKPDTEYRHLDEWSSLHAMALDNMIEMNYSISLKADEIELTQTIRDLYELVQAKKTE